MVFNLAINCVCLAIIRTGIRIKWKWMCRCGSTVTCDSSVRGAAALQLRIKSADVDWYPFRSFREVLRSDWKAAFIFRYFRAWIWTDSHTVNSLVEKILIRFRVIYIVLYPWITSWSVADTWTSTTINFLYHCIHFLSTFFPLRMSIRRHQHLLLDWLLHSIRETYYIVPRTFHDETESHVR